MLVRISTRLRMTMQTSLGDWLNTRRASRSVGPCSSDSLGAVSARCICGAALDDGDQVELSQLGLDMPNLVLQVLRT